MSFEHAANAVADLAADLRLRQIDLLGFKFGGGTALTLAAQRPNLVRRLVLVGVPPVNGLAPVSQEALVLRVKLGRAMNRSGPRGVLTRAKIVDLNEYSSDMFQAAPKTLAKPIAAFLAVKA